MTTIKTTLSAAMGIALLAATSSVLAGPITIDGALGDWGVTVQDCTGACTSTAPKVGSIYSVNAGVEFMEEDTNDLSNSYHVGPNSGGQNYDAQFLGALISGDWLYIAISSGQRNDNGFSHFAPGDILLATSVNTWGIEVGGGAGDANGNASQIEEGDAGSTYTLDSYGNTTVHSVTSTAGSIWLGSDWINDPIDPQGPTQINHNSSGTAKGSADYVFTRDSSTSQHSIIELGFELSTLGGDIASADDLTIEWRPSCGNDELSINVSLPSGGPSIPEPGVIALMGLGLAGLGFARRRQAKS